VFFFNLDKCDVINSVLLTKHYSGDKIQKNEMGGVCGKHGRQERGIQGFGEET